MIIFVRYFLREFTENVFRNNKMYRIINYSLHKQPFKVILILRFIWIPLQIKNIFTGLLRINLIHIISPLIIVELFYTLLNINTGKTIKEAMQIMSTNNQNDPKIIEIQKKQLQTQTGIAILFLTIGLLIFMFIK